MRSGPASSLLVAIALACVAGCGSKDGPSDSGWEEPPGPDQVDANWYHPWQIVPVADMPSPRGWQTARGIIHLHSNYSHDACDDEAFVEGVRNEECFDELRAALCDTEQDFAFLTDHAAVFAEYEFPEVLLYADGDTLIERGGLPVANMIPCDDGRDVIVTVGSETGSMPLGLEHHVGDTVDERYAAYEDFSATGVQALKDAGALAFVHHTEEWDPAVLAGMPLDGIEIYNLHWNLMAPGAMGTLVNMLIDLHDRPWNVPVPELGIVPLLIVSEDDMYRWSLLVAERPTTGIVATDAHRNVFAGSSPDGERLDSYRRVMHWFSNYVLLPEGAYDDVTIKDAIRAGRVWGAFHCFGYPTGFDFHAEAGGTDYEMGGAVPDGTDAILRLAIPSVEALDPEGPQPAITGRILRAIDGGEWEEVVSGGADIEYAAGQGVYRAEIVIVPDHLRPWLGMNADTYLADPKVWIYSNPIYVGMSY